MKASTKADGSPEGNGPNNSHTEAEIKALSIESGRLVVNGTHKLRIENYIVEVPWGLMDKINVLDIPGEITLKWEFKVDRNFFETCFDEIQLTHEEEGIVTINLNAEYVLDDILTFYTWHALMVAAAMVEFDEINVDAQFFDQDIDSYQLFKLTYCSKRNTIGEVIALDVMPIAANIIKRAYAFHSIVVEERKNRDDE